MCIESHCVSKFIYIYIYIHPRPPILLAASDTITLQICLRIGENYLLPPLHNQLKDRHILLPIRLVPSTATAYATLTLLLFRTRALGASATMPQERVRRRPRRRTPRAPQTNPSPPAPVHDLPVGHPCRRRSPPPPLPHFRPVTSQDEVFRYFQWNNGVLYFVECVNGTSYYTEVPGSSWYYVSCRLGWSASGY